jgi:cardiolipin synthase
MMADHMATFWAVLLATAQVLSAVFASAHAVLHKRDVRAAIGWVGLIWLVPFFGSIFYGLFGINRIRRRASDLRGHEPQLRSMRGGPGSTHEGVASALPEAHSRFAAVARLLDTIAPCPLTASNAVEPLVGGTAAYQAMLAAIEAAETSIGLSTYIFDADALGMAFVAALGRAQERGVAVRVLVDGVGVRYSQPLITARLRALGVTAAEFLPTLFPLHLPYANLRNHRKILVVDGSVGFTGGMNIRRGHLDDVAAADAIADVHFRLQGPVIRDLTATFAEDWLFATSERLAGAAWFPAQHACGPVFARVIAAGPDEDFELLRWSILAALSQARIAVRIVTPYFLPDPILATALMLAALRGVAVEIVVPLKNNLKLVEWAVYAKIGTLLSRGCRVFLTPPPFDHAKLMTVDGSWALIGSANWDPRSLRLNFELDVECYDADLARTLNGLIDARIAAATPLTPERLKARPLAVKLRDATAWLLSPYL